MLQKGNTGSYIQVVNFQTDESTLSTLGFFNRNNMRKRKGKGKEKSKEKEIVVFFNNNFPVLLENVPIQLRANICFQHDGAPPHKTRIVQQYLNETYGENWIGINRPTPWAPKSPDLTPLDFFLWGNFEKIKFTKHHLLTWNI
ncbi:hypothetical protein NQ318_009560 [Aromia moschata]|uniref:Transposase n=1 Tax=Aromia moschata TaxID=1265417 RepID=A0AAV8YB48_9CUCU|nr:hypothetical protein NQ318_009560 [Aromia moschata]